LLVVVYRNPSTIIVVGVDEYPKPTPNRLIRNADPAMIHRRSTRSMIGSDRADPMGYPTKVTAVNVRDVTIV